MNINTRYVIAWCGRMATKYGGSVYEKDRHYPWDWGQALCREQYGEDWNNLVPNDPSTEDALRASLWEKGEWPVWVDRERMIVEEER